jgi:hypothetical protein
VLVPLHDSVMHAVGSLVHVMAVPPHVPVPLHLSVWVQGLPSLHVELSGSFSVQEPSAGLQLSEQSASPSPTFAAHGSPA